MTRTVGEQPNNHKIFSQQSESCQVMLEQHQDLLRQLDSRLDSFGRLMERSFSPFPMRSGSRLQSQSSKLSRAFTKEDPFSPSSPSSPTSPTSPLGQPKISFDPALERKISPDSPSLPMTSKISEAEARHL